MRSIRRKLTGYGRRYVLDRYSVILISFSLALKSGATSVPVRNVDIPRKKETTLTHRSFWLLLFVAMQWSHENDNFYHLKLIDGKSSRVNFATISSAINDEWCNRAIDLTTHMRNVYIYTYRAGDTRARSFYLSGVRLRILSRPLLRGECDFQQIHHRCLEGERNAERQQVRGYQITEIDDELRERNT